MTQPQPALKLPRIRDGLTIQAISATEYVVKRTDSREYFSIGPQEACLLELLDGQHSVQQIQSAYEAKFSDKLSPDDLKEFIDAVQPMGLFRTPASPRPAAPRNVTNQTGSDSGDVLASDHDTTIEEPSSKRPKKGLLQDQSLLFFRVPLFDPDRTFNRLVKTLPFLWSRTFVVFACLAMVIAFCIMVLNAVDLAAGIPGTPTWRDAALFLIVMLVCTSLHEAAHGATLKFYGGEVHDTGLLFMFFTPCMYCNVSDAWLIPDKWKRLAITLAGGFCDMCCWAAGVFVWRLTVPGTAINSIAFVTLTICGGRSLLNFNPLLRLDGYYLLSDWLAIPNLRPRALDYWMGHMRWFLWGSVRPPWIPEARPLLIYGFFCWCFALVFLDLIFVRFFGYMGGQFGITGLVLVAVLLAYAFRRVFKGFFASEFGNMIHTRPRRTATWIAGITALAILLFLVPVRSTTSGDFEVRPGNVVQVHVPVNGVVQSVMVEDGSIVKEGQLIAELKSATLESDIVKTEDLLREVDASLRRLVSGSRPEEIASASDRVQRLTEWQRQGEEELRQAKIAHEHDMNVQNHRIAEITAEIANAKQELQHSEQLYQLRALAGSQLRQERLQLLQLESRLAQAQAQASATRALGVSSKEAEISRRTQELDEARDKLKLLEAGSRPEDIAAEKARHERVSHELAYLKSQQQKLRLVATTSGIFSAPRLSERVGLVAAQDSVFCTIEKPETSRVEISVSQDDATWVKPGQSVTLKVRAIPYETFEAIVEGISATATKTTAAGENVVVVHCQIKNPDGRLKSGMTGFGRIARGWNSIGMIMIGRGIRFLRTEFWW